MSEEAYIIKYINSVTNKVQRYLESFMPGRDAPEELCEKIKSLNEKLVKKVLEDVSKFKPREVHILEPDRMNEWQFANIVIELIKASSHEEEVIERANKIRKEYSKAIGFPIDEWSPEKYCYQLLIRDQRFTDKDCEGITEILNHYIGVAKAVEIEVRRSVSYVAEPDDIIRMASRTLELKYGDCDDYTVLIGSLLRAIGFRVCVGVGPHHVFPAVILPSLERIGTPPKYILRHVITPADDIKVCLFGKTYTCYDVLNFNSQFRRIIYNLLAQTEGRRLKENEQIKSLVTFLDELKCASESFTYYPIPPVNDFELKNCYHIIDLIGEEFKE
jgi:hypothetical protein